jgi:hypothetical protein
MAALKRLFGAGGLKDVDDNFKTIGERGSYTVVTADDTAGEVDINTGKADATTFMVQIFRAGVDVKSDAVVTIADGVLTIADGASTYDLTADDVIVWLAF